MAENDKPEKKKPEKTPEQKAREEEKAQLEVRKVFVRELTHQVEHAELVKRLSDAQAIDIDVKMKIQNQIKDAVRQMYGIPKQTPPTPPMYQPPAPAGQPHPQYGQPQNLPGAQNQPNPYAR